MLAHQPLNPLIVRIRLIWHIRASLVDTEGNAAKQAH
jgi:hypothetical protein